VARGGPAMHVRSEDTSLTIRHPSCRWCGNALRTAAITPYVKFRQPTLPVVPYVKLKQELFRCDCGSGALERQP
jgi:hypothetical protein